MPRYVLGAFFGLIVLDDFLASLTVGGIVGTAIGLLPLQFLPGADIRAWKLGAWALTFGIAMILLISIVVRSPLAPVSHSALWVIVALFVLFAAISIGFREFFARRWRRDHGIVVRGLRNRARDLLVPRPVVAVPEAPVDPAALHPVSQPEPLRPSISPRAARPCDPVAAATPVGTTRS